MMIVTAVPGAKAGDGRGREWRQPGDQHAADRQQAEFGIGIGGAVDRRLAASSGLAAACHNAPSAVLVASKPNSHHAASSSLPDMTLSRLGPKMASTGTKGGWARAR